MLGYIKRVQKFSSQVIPFNNGKSCPIIGLGTWKSKPGEVTEAVKHAIDVGYRHIDCAHVYENEQEIGTALKDSINSGKVSREDLFITSKLWNTFHKRDLVEIALKTSLKNLQLSYIDLYLVHWPMGYKEGKSLFPKLNGKIQYSDSNYKDTWRGMEDCANKGLAKSIGLSNFNENQVLSILKNASILPVNNQIEVHPYLTQKELILKCKSYGVTITAYSPLGSPDRHPSMKSANEKNLMEDELIQKIAKNHNKSTAQILIRYHIQNDIIVIPKSVTKSRIEDNFRIFDFKLTSEEMIALDSLNRNTRYVKMKEVSDHKDYPFRD